jgi:hypothetical protein
VHPHLSDWHQLGFGWIEILPRGCSKNVHVVEEGLHHRHLKGWEQCLSIICILGSGDRVARSDLHPHRGAVLEPAVEGPRDNEVEDWSQWAALSHPCLIGGKGRDKAINTSSRRGVREDGVDPLDQPLPRPHCLQHPLQEIPADGIICFLEV